MLLVGGVQVCLPLAPAEKKPIEVLRWASARKTFEDVVVGKCFANRFNGQKNCVQIITVQFHSSPQQDFYTN